MKKQLLLIGLILGMFTAFSQEVAKSDNTTAAKVDSTETVDEFYCPHRIQLRLGGGYSNDIFKKDIFDYQSKRTYTAMAEIGYAYLWHRKVNIGLGIGVGIGHTRPLMKLNKVGEIDVNDPGYVSIDQDARYLLTYGARNFKERQRIWAIEIPLTAQLEKKFGYGKNGIYAELGVKGYIPFSSRVDFPDGIIDITKIQDNDLNVTYTDLFVHMDPQDLKGQSIKTKMRCSIDILGEFGGVFGISRSTDFYIGAYASYGFLDITPKDKEAFNLENTPDQRLDVIVNGFLNSSVVKWNLFQVGLKLGFHFKPCKECGNKDYMKDAKRDFMDEMKKKQKEPIIVTNTVQEYYYIVPTIAPELLDESANDPAKKKALLDLAQSLSNIKILFDLDKDIPKLDDNKRDHIRNAAELLRNNPDLKVIVTGYTSPEGSVPHNQDLGQRRAIAVRQHFIDRGVPQDQIAVQNYTAEDPQHKQDIPEKDYKEQRAVIFKIEKK
jgi:outer membrane protein OmpA-like peptidoglycan-associated protein